MSTDVEACRHIILACRVILPNQKDPVTLTERSGHPRLRAHTIVYQKIIKYILKRIVTRAPTTCFLTGQA